VPRLLLLTPSELTRDPRARRAAAAALARGFDVVGLCGRLGGGEAAPLDGVSVTRVGHERVARALRKAGAGGLTESRPLARELRGVFRVGRILTLTAQLLAAARRLGRFDVVHANDFATLPAGRLIARASDARLVYDAHELYAQEEAAMPSVYRAFVRAVEGVLARRADAVVTVSEPLARELDEQLRLRRRPLVVLNAPPREEVEEPPRRDGPLRAIYQGALAPGRPVEDLWSAVAAADGVELTVRVAGADPDELRRDVVLHSLEERVRIAEPVSPDHLVAALAGHDVGVIFNRPRAGHYQVALPNRLFEYMMAGLAVVCPRLAALAELVESEGVGVTYTPGSPQALGAALAELAADRERVAALGRRARERAFERYNAEVESGQLARAWGFEPGA
jgi:glycosyltransferase involved in cell wall biosynthesis